MTDKKRDVFYPVGDHIGGHIVPYSDRIRARRTGEFRPPQAGEWYLSGSIITAYKAPADLDTAYYIAEIVEVVPVTTLKVIRRLA